MSEKSVPLRSELDPSFCWDLTPLYASPEEWESDFQKLDSLLARFLRWQGRLAESSENLLHALEDGDALGRLEEKLSVYAHLRHDEDTADPRFAELYGRIEAKLADVAGKTAWFDPELIAMDQAVFDRFRRDPVLAFYRRTLDETERERKHTLSAPEERILSMSGEIFAAPEKAFSLMNDADLRFPKITVPGGKRVELTHGNYLKYMESPDRSVRRAAFRGLHKTFGSYIHTFASLLESEVKANVLSAKLRNYPDTMTAALSGANIPCSVYKTLISSVRRNLSAVHEYYAFRAERMGLKRLEMWDIMNPVVPGAPVKRYSWDEAVRLVREACAPLGKQYGAILEKAFSERWMDVYECRGKRSGAYSSGCYDSKPYLLLNFNGTLDSVSTLAHELGHSMHSFLSNTHQAYHYASYPIFAAEIASTCNELLLNHYLMKTNPDRKFRACLLNQLLNDFRGTLFRQTMFAEFEMKIYELCEQGSVLTADRLNRLYADLNADYHGPAVHNTPEVRFEWARIPHFYYGFYVYQYATGISAAAALARKVLEGNAEPYLAFLSSGDSRDVIDAIRDAGVDFSTGAPVDAAIGLFRETLSSLKELLK